MLDRFLDESLRAGYFTDFRAHSTDQNNHLAACRHGSRIDSSQNGQVSDNLRTGYEHTSTQWKQVTTSTGTQQDLVHMGAWTKERLPLPKTAASAVDGSRLPTKLGG